MDKRKALMKKMKNVPTRKIVNDKARQMKEVNSLKAATDSDTSKKTTSGRRSNRLKPLKYEIDPAVDDLLVRSIKKKVNSMNINSEFIYSKFDDSGEAWNLIYGLRVRSKISTNMLLKWCNVLDLEPIVILKAKDQSMEDVIKEAGL